MDFQWLFFLLKEGIYVTVCISKSMAGSCDGPIFTGYVCSFQGVVLYVCLPFRPATMLCHSPHAKYANFLVGSIDRNKEMELHDCIRIAKCFVRQSQMGKLCCIRKEPRLLASFI